MADFSGTTTPSEIWREVGLFVTAIVTMFPNIAADNVESNLDEAQKCFAACRYVNE